MPATTQVEKTCQNCGAAFHVKRSWAAERRYCSTACMRSYEKVHGRAAAQVAPVGLTCQRCGNHFTVTAANLRAHRNRYAKDPAYCSRKCAGLARRLRTEANATFICKHCGKESSMRRYEWSGTDRSAARTKYDRTQQFCSMECKNLWQAAEAARRFRRGEMKRHIKKGGYVYVSVPSLIKGKKTEVLEHRYVMEQHLGRPLHAEETVHHKDGNRQNNALANLQLFAHNHGPGQEVEDIVEWCVKMLERYPEFTSAQQRARLRQILNVKREHLPALTAPPLLL